MTSRVTVLMVAEKPMLADSIAKLLSDKRANKRRGFNNACSISEYDGTFHGTSAHFKVTSTCGHVNTLDFPSKFNNWQQTEPIELFDAPTEKKEATPKLRMNEFLASEARNCDYLVLWLDCDKEGENICFEVIDAVSRSLKRPTSGNIMDIVYRAQFSAITEKDVKAAMRSLVRPNHNESLSVDARQELDLRIGCAFTRFQTKYFQEKYADLNSLLVSFGPCQTPTLGFCVTRHDDITQFCPEPYWQLQVTIETRIGCQLKPEWSRGRIFDKQICELFIERIKKYKTAKIYDISQKESSKQKPQALNTIELLRIASSSLGFGPQFTMSIAEHLYTQGFISYPRTETTCYPDSFDLRTPLKEQTGDREWGEIAKQILSNGIVKPRSGDDKGDHPPITPMRSNDGYLTGDHLRLYQYIVQHFLATLMNPCRYLSTTISLTIGDEHFTIVGKTLIDAGYTAIMTWQSIDDEVLPSVMIGDELQIKDIRMIEKQTSPPDYLTESELISLMEKHCIGTDASISVHINNICVRNYVSLETGRRLKPTKLGIALVHGYCKVDYELVLPTMRAEIEAQLNLIAKGEANYHDIVHHVIDNYRRKFEYFVENITLIDALFEDSFTTVADAGKPFSRCGKCRRYMKLVDSRPQRLHCPYCQDTYALPTAKDGVLKLHSEKQCPLDNFELVYWQGPHGMLSRSFVLCPCCFNNPPFPDMNKQQGCNECTHPHCPNAFSTQAIVKCSKCPLGVLVLDPQSGPKWRITCNKCTVIVGLFAGNDAQHVRVLDNKCNQCGAQLIGADFKKEVEKPFVGCIFCTESTSISLTYHQHQLVDQRHNNSSSNRRGRGRGSGRGRGGGPSDRGRGGSTRSRGGSDRGRDRR